MGWAGGHLLLGSTKARLIVVALQNPIASGCSSLHIPFVPQCNCHSRNGNPPVMHLFNSSSDGQVVACCALAGMLLKQAHALSMRTAFLRRCEGADLLQALPIGVELQAGPISCSVSIEPGNEGCYSCTYTGREAGSYRLLVTCKGKPIGGSPFSVMVQHTPLQARLMLRSMWLTVASAMSREACPHLGKCILQGAVLAPQCSGAVMLRERVPKRHSACR